MQRDGRHSHDEEERVRQAVRERLRLSCEFHWRYSQIRVHFRDGVLQLEGVLPSFYLKQKLQTYLQGIEGVEHVRNEIKVVGTIGPEGPESSRERRRSIDG